MQGTTWCDHCEKEGTWYTETEAPSHFVCGSCGVGHFLLFCKTCDQHVKCSDETDPVCVTCESSLTTPSDCPSVIFKLVKVDDPITKKTQATWWPVARFSLLLFALLYVYYKFFGVTWLK